MAAAAWERLIQDITDLNEEIGKSVYILIVDDVMVASTRKSDINEFLADEKQLVIELMSLNDKSKRAVSDIYIIYGLLLNPLELPMELPPDLLEDYDVWMLKKDYSSDLAGFIEFERCDDIEEVTHTIEEHMEREPHLEIEDFAVLMGAEVDLVLQIDSDIKIINAKCLE